MRLAFALALTPILALGPQVLGQQMTGGRFSERAGSVITVALGEAQQRGASAVDVNDLVFALILEDQEPDAPYLFEETPPGALVPEGWVYPSGARLHRAFLPPRIDINLLVKLDEFLPRSASIPRGTEMQTSEAYNRVLQVAKSLPGQLHQGEVRINNGDRDHPPGMYQAVVPLDLLAAALLEPCEGTKLLQAAGITEEKVIQAIRAGGDLEKGTPLETP